MSNSSENVNRRQQALAMAARGFRVFPCVANSKKPAVNDWPKVATTNPAAIGGWFDACPDMNYGAVPGDDYFVADLDNKAAKDGKRARDGKRDMLALIEKNGALPDTFVVQTPNNGYHLYLKGTAANSVAKKSLGGGIDIRGRRGYVVGPGSIINGNEYKIIEDLPIAAAPAWFIDLVKITVAEPAKRVEGVADNSPHEISKMRTYLRARVEQGDVAIEFCGGNNRTLALANEVMDYVNEEITSELLAKEWNPSCDPPWSEEELRGIVHNAAKYRQNDIGAKASKPAEEAFAAYGQKVRRDQAKGGSFKGMSYQTAAETKTQRIEWLWKPRFPAGMLSIIGGDPDCGKSTIMYSLAATITRSGNLPLGEGAVEIGRVLVLAGEESKNRVSVPRLKAAGADLRYVSFVDPLVKDEGIEQPRLIDLAMDLDKIKGVIAALEADGGPKVKLLVIDPLSAYLGAGANSFKASDMRRVLTPISDWADKQQIAVIVVAHLNKSNATTNALNRLSDSHAIGALSRAAWLAAPERDEDGHPTDYFLLMRGKNNLTPRDTPNLRYRIEGVDVLLDDGTTYNHPRIVWCNHVTTTASEAFSPDYVKPKTKGDLAEAFLKAALADGPVRVTTLQAMATERGFSWRTLQRVKAKLSVRSEAVGDLAKFGYHVWRLRTAADSELSPLYADDAIDPSDPDFALLNPDSRLH
jgi:hypothetical protein